MLQNPQLFEKWYGASSGKFHNDSLQLKIQEIINYVRAK